MSRILGKFVFMFEVDATPVSVALFFPRVSGRKGFLSLNGCAVLALFALKTGKVRPGIREKQRPIHPVFSF